MLLRFAWLACIVLGAGPVRAASDLPIFDAHLHYNAEATAIYPVEKVLALFRANGVAGILANSRPNDGTHAILSAEAADLWVVPFIRPYVTRDDIGTWFKDPKILALIETELRRGIYKGIGEFHLSGRDAEGAQVARIVNLAAERGLWLHAHSDMTGVDALYRHDARSRIIWAHTGFSTSAEDVERMLERHTTLMGELSYRGGITDGAKLTEEWRRLFARRADRFLLGSDTWINERWEGYGRLIGGYREWLDQLPRDAAEKIAFRNAERLFGPK